MVANPRRLTGLMLIAGALVVLAAAAAIYVEMLPSFGVRRQILAGVLAIVGTIDGITGFVFVIKS